MLKSKAFRKRSSVNATKEWVQPANNSCDTQTCREIVWATKLTPIYKRRTNTKSKSQEMPRDAWYPPGIPNWFPLRCLHCWLLQCRFSEVLRRCQRMGWIKIKDLQGAVQIAIFSIHFSTIVWHMMGDLLFLAPPNTYHGPVAAAIFQLKCTGGLPWWISHYLKTL